jgi:LPXTG-motif cell wall-anchored protein
MKVHRIQLPRTALVLACGVVLAGSLTTTARGDEWNKKTILTVNEPIQVRDTYLEPGQYVLRLLNSQSDRHVVQIFNRNESQIIDTVMAIPKERLEPTGKSEFTFWETPPGTARALRSWFYPGDLIGQEFPYPKHPRTIAVASVAAPPPAPVATPAPTPEAAPTPVPETNAAPAEPAPTPVPTPVETAPAPEPTPVQPPAPEPVPTQPTELPKTGTLYPLFGLAGLGLVGLGGLLRVRTHS